MGEPWGSPAQRWARSRRGWTGILSASTGQSAHSTINNCWESLGSHRTIYFITFPACWARWIATQRHLCPSAGTFLPCTKSELLRGRWWLCSLPRLGTVWAGDCGELHFGDNVVSATAFEGSARHQSRCSTTTTCLLTYEQFAAGLGWMRSKQIWIYCSLHLQVRVWKVEKMTEFLIFF